MASKAISGCLIGASLSEPHTSESNGGFFIGASVSEPLLSDVYVNFVCHGPSGIATAHASHFLHMDRTAWQRRMRLIFMQVAVYVTMVTLFRQSIDNTYLESLARSEYL